jgi:hypothetical protein
MLGRVCSDFSLSRYTKKNEDTRRKMKKNIAQNGIRRS